MIQLARYLEQEWGFVKDNESGGICVNGLSPGHTYTPMVEKTFQDASGAKNILEKENMMHKIARRWEFRGVSQFLMTGASSFMTSNAIVMDGGHTA